MWLCLQCVHIVVLLQIRSKEDNLHSEIIPHTPRKRGTKGKPPSHQLMVIPSKGISSKMHSSIIILGCGPLLQEFPTRPFPKVTKIEWIMCCCFAVALSNPSVARIKNEGLAGSIFILVTTGSAVRYGGVWTLYFGAGSGAGP